MGVAVQLRRARARVSCALLACAAAALLCSAVSVVFLLRVTEPLSRHAGSLSAMVDVVRETTDFVFIAANMRNMAPVFGTLTRALTELSGALGSHRVFVSIVQGGSTDDTPALLASWSRRLRELSIAHVFRTVNDPCTELAQMDETCAEACAGAPLSKCRRPLLRITAMAALRNEALAPLVRGLNGSADPLSAAARSDAGDVLARMRASASRTRILFVNDVVATAADLAALLENRGVPYDMACAADFNPLLYDTAVARTSTGSTLVKYYPYFRVEADRARVRNGDPVPVSSCWNGAVAMPAEPFVRHANPVRFRAVNEGACVFVECKTVCEDLRAAGYGRVFMNFNVRLYYSRAHQLLNEWVLQPFDHLVLAWMNRVGELSTDRYSGCSYDSEDLLEVAASYFSRQTQPAVANDA